MNDIKELISISDIDKLDVRVGQILEVSDVPNSSKLVKLHVDFSDFERNILVGLKGERENPKEIEGRQALFVVNLLPKKMAGVVSEGMFFDIGYASGIIPVLAVPECHVSNGTKVG